MTMMIPANFTLDQLLAYLRSGEQPEEGFYTAGEWAARFGIGTAKMRNILSEAKAAGRLKQATVRRERLDSVMMPFPAYAFILDDPGENPSPCPPPEGEGAERKN